MTKDQRRLLRNTLKGVGGDFSSTLMQLLNPEFGQSGFEDQFQQGVVEPAMRDYTESILPALEQRYGDINAGSSSALNQALARSSEDLTNMLAGQRIGYQGQQQQLRQQAQSTALQQIMNLMGQKAYQPIVQGPSEGLVKPLIGAGGQLGSAAILASAISSKLAKENIRDYEKSLEVLDKVKVKQYDYKIDVPGGTKDRVGLIAEDLPPEITNVEDGYLHVDIYGLVSILVNCVKDLNENVNQIKKKLNEKEAKSWQ